MADVYETIRNPLFRDKCKANFQKAAIAISMESASTEHYAARQVLCGKILHGQMSTLEMAFAVAMDDGIKAKIVGDKDYDGDIYGVVSGLFNPFAVSLAALS